jgi:glycosyltransferase involved in cell wall biosynthesis
MSGIVVIPAFNEERNLAGVLSRLRATPHAASVVVVDDGSADRTEDVARAQGAIVLRHLTNLGYAHALQTGLTFALRAGADYCITLDADGQHDPAHIDRLVARAKDPDRPHIVIGSRFLEAPYRAPLGRRLGMQLFSQLTRLGGGRRLYDTTSGFKLMSRPAMQALVNLSTGDLHSEMIIYSLLRGLRVAEVPISVAEREHGQSMYDLFSSLVYPVKTVVAIALLIAQARREGPVAGA